MKILIATRNNDKFTNFLRTLTALFSDAIVVSLSTVAIDGDIEEQGSIAERSLQKARFFSQRLKDLGRSDEFDVVMGIDDGFQIGEDEPTANSKELTDDVLAGKFPAGTPLYVHQFFSAVFPDGTERTDSAIVPLTILENIKGIKREEGRYPLSHVTAPAGRALPFTETSVEEQVAFSLRYRREPLTRLLQNKF